MINTYACISRYNLLQGKDESGKDESKDDDAKSKSDVKKFPQRGKKRKQPNKLEKSLQVVMDQFVTVQHETENKYIELEEKRLKYMKESEAHKMEMEEGRCEADRQHELQMWSMFMSVCGGGGSGMNYGVPPPP